MVSFLWARSRVFDHQFCVILAEMCVENPLATVISVRGQQRSRYRPVGLTTTELQKAASRLFSLSPADTLDIAEKLYQGGFLSYPRTETDQFPPSLDLQAIVSEHAAHPAWGAFVRERLLPGPPTPRNGNNTDEAHPPIHPTRLALPDSFSSDQHRKIYELVTRSFLACCSSDAKGQETTVSIDLAGETVSFV